VVVSVDGVAFVAGPAVGVLLYGIAWPLPFAATGALLIALDIWAGFRLRTSRPREG
jgi:hypothetical protein